MGRFVKQVANKLYPLSFIAQRIEDFAIEKLLSLKSCDATEKTDAEGSKNELQKVLIFALSMWGFYQIYFVLLK